MLLRLSLVLFFLGITLCYYAPIVVMDKQNYDTPIITSFPKSTKEKEGGHPIQQNSNFTYVSSPSMVYVNGIQGMFMQVSEKNETTGLPLPAGIAFVPQIKDLKFAEVGLDSVILEPEEDSEEGVENPRVYFKADENKYYMFYTARTHGNKYLSIATCDLNSGHKANSSDCWIKRGLVFDNQTEAIRGASLLLRQSPPHYLYYHANKNIEVATTMDMIHYTKKGTLLTPRADRFDSIFVESGPQPIQLSDGQYMMLYNGAKYDKTIVNTKNSTVQAGIGFVILDKEDPSKVVYRHNNAILTPDLAWERCDSFSKTLDDTVPYQALGLTPNSVGVASWTQLKSEGGVDSFLAFYQAAESSIAAFKLTVMPQADTIWDWILIILILIVLGICVASCLIAIVATLIFRLSPRSLAQGFKFADNFKEKLNTKKPAQKNFLAL